MAVEKSFQAKFIFYYYGTICKNLW